MLVTHDLHLDVAGAAHQFFQIDLVVAKCGQCLTFGQFHHWGQVGLGFDHSHATATAAPAGLEHQGVTYGQRHEFGAFNVVGQGTGGGHHRHTGGNRHGAGRHLVAQGAHDIPFGTDEGDASCGAGVGKVGVLAQKTVAGVNCVDFCLFGDADDVCDVEVGRDWFFARTHQVRLVGLEAVQGKAVFVGKDGHRADAHFGGGAQHPDGDFAAVGDKDAADFFHGGARKVLKIGGCLLR